MAAAILFWLSIQQERWLIVVDLDTGLSFLSKKVFFFTSNVSCIADSMARNDRLPFIGRVIHPFQAQLDTELSLHVNELALVIHFFYNCSFSDAIYVLAATTTQLANKERSQFCFTTVICSLINHPGAIYGIN